MSNRQMPHDLITTDNRSLAPQRTAAGAIALRLTMSSGAWMVDAGDLPSWLTPSVRAALPAAVEEARALCAPAVGRDFKRTVTSALVLVAGVGMTQDESRAWQAAAAEALRGIPVDLLELGCSVARRTCDHPSKIVPAIIKTVGKAWDGRRADLAKLQRIAAAADTERPVPIDLCRPEEVAAILAEFGIRRSEAAPREVGAKPEATIDDYIEQGLSREDAEKAIVERRRLLSRRPGTPIGAAAANVAAAIPVQATPQA